MTNDNTMLHYGSKDYATAAKDAAAYTAQRFQKRIDQGAKLTGQLVHRLQTEVPEDVIAKHANLAFRFGQPQHAAPAALTLQEAAEQDLRDDDGIPLAISALLDETPAPAPASGDDDMPRLLLDVADGSRVYTVHGHALGQIASRAKVPTKYLRGLVESDNKDLKELSLDILRTHYGRTAMADTKSLQRQTDLSVSAVRDAVKHVLNPDTIQNMQDGIKAAMQTTTTWKDVERNLRASQLTKAEKVQAAALFDGEESYLLPPGATKWRASNVLSLMAQSAGTAERRLQLERAAGDVMATPPIAGTVRNARKAISA